MKKLIFIFMLLPLVASAKVNVVGTLPVFASLAQEIGGDRVETKSLARGNQDPHFLDAKPSFVVILNKADLLIHGGLGLEIGWLPPILVQARNPKINPNNSGNVDLSQNIHVLEIPQGKVDRSQGDVHPQGNPHAWLDPNNVKVMAENIAKHLSEIDPQGRDYYQERLKIFTETLNQKRSQWEKEAAILRGKNVISYHKSLSYLADWTGLQVAATIEPKPGIPPSSKHVDNLIDQIPAFNIKALLVEIYYPKKVPEYLAQKAKIPLATIAINVGEEGIKNYFELMDHLIAKIKEVL